MSNYEEKLTKFKNNCEKNAKQDEKNINNELNKKIEENISDEINKYKENAEIKLKNKLDKVEKEYNSKKFEIDMELKKDVLKEQETLKNRIFDDMIEYVKAFTDTSDYEKFFLKSLKDANPANEDTLELTQKDYNKFENKIKEIAPNIEIKIINEVYIGGFILISEKNNVYINNTLLEYLNEKI